MIAASIVALYYIQTLRGDAVSEAYRWGLIPVRVQAGDYLGLFTSLVMHGGWAHALVNAAFGLALGTPVARLIGTSPRHALAFFLFYIACGVGANVVYVFLHAGSEIPLVGASGAVSGLMGAAARLMNRGGVLGPVLSRSVFSFTAAWVALNVVLGVIGFAPGMGPASIAWEAHLAGYFIGLLLIGPWAALFGQRRAVEETTPSVDGPWGAPPADPIAPPHGDERVN